MVTEKLRIEELPSIWHLEDHTDWLVEGLLPLGTVTLLSGDSGSGKSTLALALADAVVNGKPFLNRQVKQSEVLIVDKENGIRTYSTRLHRLKLTPHDNLRVWGLWVSPEPEGPHDHTIREYVQRTHPLVIFDSLIAFHPGSEQDASETRDYMHEFRRLTEAGATVLVIHHTGKGENTRNYRGSSDIKAGVDSAYVLTARAGLQNLRLRPFKSREGDLEEICIKYENGEFLMDRDYELASVVKYVRENPGQCGSDVVKALTGRASAPRIRHLLKLAVDQQKIRLVPGAKHTFLYYPAE